MDKPALYILPGNSRLKDRIVPAEILKIEHYAPSRDMNLSEEDRLYRPDAIKVTVRGEKAQVFPFVLPCSFKSEWDNLEAAAQDMGFDLAISEPVKDEDSIGRSIIRSWFATADGCVYTARRPTDSNMLITEQLPIRLDAVWIQHQLASADVSPPEMPSECLRG